MGNCCSNRNTASVITCEFYHYKYHTVDDYDSLHQCMKKQTTRYKYIIRSNKTPLPLGWEYDPNKWFFTFVQKATYKSRFIIYYDVTFDKTIAFENAEISHRHQY